MDVVSVQRDMLLVLMDHVLHATQQNVVQATQSDRLHRIVVYARQTRANVRAVFMDTSLNQVHVFHVEQMNAVLKKPHHQSRIV